MKMSVHANGLSVIREQDPLKQGLKPEFLKYLVAGVRIREQDPLKQGVKQGIPELEKDKHAEQFASKIH